MTAILLIGLGNALLAAVFWIVEAADFTRAVKLLWIPNAKNPVHLFIQCLAYVGGFILHLPKLWKLVLDVMLTVWLAGAFGFSGMIGSIIGLSVSNVISIYIISIKRKEVRHEV
jgi:hypothetical protein